MTPNNLFLCARHHTILRHELRKNNAHVLRNSPVSRGQEVPFLIFKLKS